MGERVRERINFTRRKKSEISESLRTCYSVKTLSGLLSY